MSNTLFDERKAKVTADFEALITRPNEQLFSQNGIYNKYKYPVVTREHVPLEWRYDFDPKDNPYFMERISFNATLNAGAMKLGDKYLLVVRTEGVDRKSFFAVAESPNGVDNFRFSPRPITMPQVPANPDTNVYDMRLTKHDDGYIYGVFCSERKDPAAPAGDTSSAVAAAGIARTKDLKTWQRLPTSSVMPVSSATSSSSLTSSTASTPSTPVHKMASSIQVRAAASAGVSATTSAAPGQR